jgi:hypothetical protein
MPSFIVFGKLRGKDAGGDRVKVTDEPEQVVDTLSSTGNGFVRFDEASKQGRARGSIWVNVGQVRAVREARASDDRGGGDVEEVEGG